MRINELLEGLGTQLLKRAGRGALKSSPEWASNPKVADGLAQMTPQLRREFLVRFPDQRAVEHSLDDIYQQAQALHNSGNKTAARSLMDAHDHLNMMLTTGPTDDLMLLFKQALKNQTP